MAPQTQRKSGGAKKIGRNKTKCEAYRNSKRREYNKLKRVVQSNGLVAAEAYMLKHGLKRRF
jgi:hypothetical protein